MPITESSDNLSCLPSSSSRYAKGLRIQIETNTKKWHLINIRDYSYEARVAFTVLSVQQVRDAMKPVVPHCRSSHKAKLERDGKKSLPVFLN